MKRKTNITLETRTTAFIFPALLLCALIVGLNTLVFCQPADIAASKAKAKVVIEAQKFTEALPLYEALAKQAPNDAEIRLYLGFSLLGQAATIDDQAQRRQLRIRARDSFVLARDLGDKSILVLGLIDGIPPDGDVSAGYSDNAAANKLMEQGEAFFASGKLDDALKAYQDALLLDPRCYYAALFAGDVHTQKGNFDEAVKWYQKAIAIDPNTETGYRYSATPLMKQGKYDQARDLYIEAFIIAPYDRLALNGIIQWAQATKAQLGHPNIDIPEIKIGPDGKVNSTININPGADDGSLAWSSYIATRDIWRQGKFLKQYPKETVYRHSLLEEADALRSVVSSAKALKPKTLNAQIATLAKMDQDGVLEAYILMAIPDQGIATDHRAYLRAHRDKLRQYVVNYVIHGAN